MAATLSRHFHRSWGKMRAFTSRALIGLAACACVAALMLLALVREPTRPPSQRARAASVRAVASAVRARKADPLGLEQRLGAIEKAADVEDHADFGESDMDGNKLVTAQVCARARAGGF